MRLAAALLFFAPLFAVAQQHPVVACIVAATQDESLDPIRTKIAVGGKGSDEITFKMLTDETKPSDREKEALAKWAEMIATCMKSEPRPRAIAVDAAALLEAYGSGLIALTASLYSRELTYGQFNKERSERAQRLGVAISTIRQRETSRAEAEEQARRLAAVQIMLSQPQPVFLTAPSYRAPVNPTVTTNCFRFGGQLTCTSR